jgi:hypothetical protein
MITEQPGHHTHHQPDRRERRDMERLRLLMHHLHDSPLELSEEQRELAETMVRRLLKDIHDGRHPIIGDLLNQPDRADEVAENLVSPISRFVKCMHVDHHMISDSMLHHLEEPDHFQQSAVETPAEELLRKLRSKDEGLANYLELEEIEKKEAKGTLPKESAITFMARMKEAHASMRVPGLHERRYLNNLIEGMKHAVENVTSHMHL